MTLILGDSLIELAKLEPNSIDAVVTDPPYGLSFMGKKWDYDVPSVEIWREVIRVMKPGAHLLSFGGTRTYHRMVVAIEEAGFEIRDQLQWLFGSGFPKSHNIGEGRGTALKPANEPIVLARKPLSEKTVAANVLKWGTGALNIDASRIEGVPPSVPQPAFNTTGEIYNMKTGEGRNGTMSNSTQGRWPANLLLDERAAESLGEPSRFFYIAKASKRERNAGLEGMPEKAKQTLNSYGDQTKFECPDGASRVGNKGTLVGANHHPTVKPIKLMEYLCRLITPPGGVILDPFMGSGSTGVAAKNLGFKFIGIEMNAEYLEISKRRIKHMELK